jgi:hypothetical protein
LVSTLSSRKPTILIHGTRATSYLNFSKINIIHDPEDKEQEIEKI